MYNKIKTSNDNSKDINNLYTQLKKLRTEVFELKNPSKEDEFLKSIILNKTKVNFVFIDGLCIQGCIKDSFRHCLLIDHENGLSLIQKSSLKYFNFLPQTP